MGQNDQNPKEKYTIAIDTQVVQIWKFLDSNLKITMNNMLKKIKEGEEFHKRLKSI